MDSCPQSWKAWLSVSLKSQAGMLPSFEIVGQQMSALKLNAGNTLGTSTDILFLGRGWRPPNCICIKAGLAPGKDVGRWQRARLSAPRVWRRLKPPNIRGLMMLFIFLEGRQKHIWCSPLSAPHFPRIDVNKQCNRRIQMKQVSFPCMWYNTVGKSENKSNALKANRMQMKVWRTVGIWAFILLSSPL